MQIEKKKLEKNQLKRLFIALTFNRKCFSPINVAKFQIYSSA